MINLLIPNAIGIDYIALNDHSILGMATQLARTLKPHSILIAWSFGGLIATKIAACFPEKVSKLILIASQPKFVETNNWQGITEQNAHYILTQANLNFAKLFNHFLSLAQYPAHSREIKNSLLSFALPQHKNALNILLKQLVELDLRHDYQSISCPILHLCGSNDAIINQKNHALELLNKNSRIESIQGAGHTGLLTHRLTYLNHILGFINDN